MTAIVTNRLSSISANGRGTRNPIGLCIYRLAEVISQSIARAQRLEVTLPRRIMFAHTAGPHGSALNKQTQSVQQRFYDECFAFQPRAIGVCVRSARLTVG